MDQRRARDKSQRDRSDTVMQQRKNHCSSICLSASDCMRACRWQDHPMTCVLLDTLKGIQRWLPRCGVLENVVEIGWGEENALQIILNRLHESNYATTTVEPDLAWFHANCSRRRRLVRASCNEYQFLFCVSRAQSSGCACYSGMTGSAAQDLAGIFWRKGENLDFGFS